jgi:hypothetical protein
MLPDGFDSPIRPRPDSATFLSQHYLVGKDELIHFGQQVNYLWLGWRSCWWVQVEWQRFS